MFCYYLYLKLILMSYFVNLSTTFEQSCNKNKELPLHLQIKERILCDYDKTIRPVINSNTTFIEIKFLIHHFDFDLHNGLIEINAWFGMRWTDEHIHWDPEAYKGINTIFLTSNDVWTPDLSIYNRGSYGSSQIIQSESDCLLFYYKKVACVAQTELRAMCTPDLRHYPFDVQNCTLKIGSWYHSGEEIDLADTEILTDISTYTQHSLNPEWTMESATYEKNPGKYKYSDDTFPSLKFNFVIRRNSNAKFAVIIVPILVLVGMSIIALWLDPASSDRIFIFTINIPAHIMTILNFEWDLPETGNSVPYLIQLMRNSQLIVLFTLVETIVVRHFLNKTKESPRFLVNIFTVFANNKVGQLLLFSEINPENAAENLTADDSSNLVEVTERPKEWYLLGRVIDRLSFVISMLLYFIMVMLWIPKK